MAAAASSSSSSATAARRDVEAQQSNKSQKNSHWSILTDQAGVDDAVLNHKYSGHGTNESPYLVEFLPVDPRNPMTFPSLFKWQIMIISAVSTLAVSFTSSAYSGSILAVKDEFHASIEVVTLGVSMFVLGFAIGPLFWAPFSELYGRQKLFFLTYMALTAFNAAGAGAPNMTALIVLRFMAGAWGSSPLTNSGGVIADLFTATERGIATSIFAIAPFLGPALGPIAGGFLAEAQGWRWVEGLTAIFTGALWIIQTLVAPETYSPVLLRRRAEELSRRTGKVYISKVDAAMPRKTLLGQIKVNLSRPWVLLFKEPIVFLTSIYMAIVYGTLYLCFAAFPIVFQSPYPEGWGWKAGVGGLSFVGIAIGMIASTAGSILDNRRYARIAAKCGGTAPPEARLPPAVAGGVLLPVGLFWFAWTNGTNVHWVVPIIGSSVFAAGLVLVFLSLLNYLIDSYVIYAASVLAASAVLRSLFGYGEKIRLKCKYSAEASHIFQQILAKQQPALEDDGATESDEGMRGKRNEGVKSAPTAVLP
ncbi:Major facilitator superfamily domain, general substrate transporter [Metarhizium album ARSEF 1941]|uniref:Major facilitator superfamily domain, general substrate transporter n=1 Tax=Metarhizium album (strain ARSEF 1941) TaxID=1081103 RepID=A0A0B2WRM8_METAS|nr:Major facilitator superfamily domain, general substrate transporter [Metarhizium album ARSEF 1941]KHN96244.1 Major facilitator superfamily domain, general substrate transporter [Metarhizium album ARSEF 1941]